MARQAAAASVSPRSASNSQYVGLLDERADRNEVRRAVHEVVLSKFTLRASVLEAVGWFPGDGPPQPRYLPASVAHQENHLRCAYELEDRIDALSCQKAKEITMLNLTRAKVAYPRKYTAASSDEEGSPLGDSLDDKQ